MKSYNPIERICNIKEAVGFLVANAINLKRFHQTNLAKYQNPKEVQFSYFRIYPQLAGKIAEILS
ncbi:hypothetical protein [Helicobacter sp. MIT 05-5294]|uniref:hypothetical protein n=1 Tax=Helicobacter sp. MIT 05-5294 TaxID=1548150 RepID=UPI000B15BCBF|nr:hypothetical protein [Helicobacter sp. MIT 05-5294]TLD85495.1 hypothetical protein LS69_009210 [Helicobacter sp. MIT 05-5294]